MGQKADGGGMIGYDFKNTTRNKGEKYEDKKIRMGRSGLCPDRVYGHGPHQVAFPVGRAWLKK